MAYSLENTTDLTAVANAIRSKTGEAGSLTVSDMATAISNLVVGGGSSKNWTRKVEYFTANVSISTTAKSYSLGILKTNKKPFIALLFGSNSSSGTNLGGYAVIGNLNNDTYTLTKYILLANGNFSMNFAVEEPSDSQYVNLRITNVVQSTRYFRASDNQSDPHSWLTIFTEAD